MNAPFNTRIAMKLQEMAELLEQQNANLFRIKAYRQAAIFLAELERDVIES